MAIPLPVAVAGGRAVLKLIGKQFARHSGTPGTYTLGNQKYLQHVAAGTAPITDAWLNNRAARDLPKLEKLLQVQPGASGPVPSTADVLSSTPLMPGGAWATPQGVQPAAGPVPPLWFGGNGTGGGGRRRKKSKSKARRATSSRKRSGRKLKFGSPAWRKKYLSKKGARKARAR